MPRQPIQPVPPDVLDTHRGPDGRVLGLRIRPRGRAHGLSDLDGTHDSRYKVPASTSPAAPVAREQYVVTFRVRNGAFGGQMQEGP
ncbi:MAG: hypothetical protein Q8M17_10025 [Actinomycetota bacterium]|nr:hypothetical protein [Actinomycetota bacterium]